MLAQKLRRGVVAGLGSIVVGSGPTRLAFRVFKSVLPLRSLDAVSPTVVAGVDANISHALAGSLALSQSEKRRRDVNQCSVFYSIHFLTRRGAATAVHAFVIGRCVY